MSLLTGRGRGLAWRAMASRDEAAEANSEDGKISILAPIATAILGYRKGHTVEFQAPARIRRLKIEDILYQPESAGDLDA